MSEKPTALTRTEFKSAFAAKQKAFDVWANLESERAKERALAPLPDVLSKVTKFDAQIPCGKLDYVVIKCGYTVRLLAHYLDLGASFTLTYDKQGMVGYGRKGFMGRSRDADKDTVVTKDRVKTLDEGVYDTYSKGTCKYPTQPDYDKTGRLETKDKQRQPDMPVFICDTLWGDGLYTTVGISEQQQREVKMLLEAKRVYGIQTGVVHRETSEIEAAYGTIAFPCEDLENARRIVRNLFTLKHCAWFSVKHEKAAVWEMKNGQRVLWMSFDTERGLLPPPRHPPPRW